MLTQSQRYARLDNEVTDAQFAAIERSWNRGGFEQVEQFHGHAIAEWYRDQYAGA